MLQECFKNAQKSAGWAQKWKQMGLAKEKEELETMRRELQEAKQQVEAERQMAEAREERQEQPKAKELEDLKDLRTCERIDFKEYILIYNDI